MIRSALLGFARSGTNLMLSKLNSHPDVFFHGEIFHFDGVRGLHGRDSLVAEIGETPEAFRARDPVAFLDAAYRLAPPRPVVGFKLFINHFGVMQRHLAQQADVRLIVLERANRLGSYSSMNIGRMTNIWLQTEPAQSDAKLDFDRTAFLDYVTYVDRHYARVREMLAGRDHTVWLEYRDINTPEADAAITALLGLNPQHPLKPGIVKQNTARPIERFTSPDAVMAALDEIGKPEWAELG